MATPDYPGRRPQYRSTTRVGFLDLPGGDVLSIYQGTGFDGDIGVVAGFELTVDMAPSVARHLSALLLTAATKLEEEDES